MADARKRPLLSLGTHTHTERERERERESACGEDNRDWLQYMLKEEEDSPPAPRVTTYKVHRSRDPRVRLLL